LRITVEVSDLEPGRTKSHSVAKYLRAALKVQAETKLGKQEQFEAGQGSGPAECGWSRFDHCEKGVERIIEALVGLCLRKRRRSQCGNPFHRGSRKRLGQEWCPALHEFDLSVRQLGVLADREARVDGQDGDEPVLEAPALGERRDTGQRLEALVDLQGIGRHRDGPLAARAQPLGDGHGERGLPDAGGPEDRQHGRLGGGHWAGVSSGG